MKLKWLAIALALVIAAAFLDSCDDTGTTDQQISSQQAASLAQANQQVGLPDVTNFTEMKLVKYLYELRDKANLSTYAYTVDYNGHLHKLCDSIGYGIPYAVQFTNPEKSNWTGGGTFYQTPQAEPNGLFMPADAEGTWVICADPTGKPSPVYVEPRVVVSPTPLVSIDNWEPTSK